MIYHTVDTAEYGVPDNPYGTFRDLRQAVTKAIRACEQKVKKFDVIVVQGTSGMSLGFPLALALDVDIVVVRKASEKEDSHWGSNPLTGVSVDHKRCLFVDDFVSGGATRQRVRQAVELKGGKLVAQYTSRDDSFTAL